MKVIRNCHRSSKKGGAKIIQFKSKAKSQFSSQSNLEIDPVLERVKTVIEAHYADYGLDVTKLCKLAAVSRTQLHRKLKELSGMSATEFIRHYRLRKAKLLLCGSKMSITCIALEVGFSNPNYFSRVFMDVFGISPTEFRNRHG